MGYYVRSIFDGLAFFYLFVIARIILLAALQEVFDRASKSVLKSSIGHPITVLLRL
jgi:hypothetical protein